MGNEELLSAGRAASGAYLAGDARGRLRKKRRDHVCRKRMTSVAVVQRPKAREPQVVAANDSEGLQICRRDIDRRTFRRHFIVLTSTFMGRIGCIIMQLPLAALHHTRTNHNFELKKKIKRAFTSYFLRKRVYWPMKERQRCAEKSPLSTKQPLEPSSSSFSLL